MAIVNIELPFYLLVAGVICALTGWLLGSFTHQLRGWRYRMALGSIALPLSGLMGLFSVLKLCMSLFGDWFSSHPISVLLALGYVGYAIFGILGCWTAIVIGGRLDRRNMLSMLYNLLEDSKRPKAE